MSLSVDANLLPKLDWLQENIGLSREALRREVVKRPYIPLCSLDGRYRPRLEACRTAGVPVITVLTRISDSNDRFYPFIGEDIPGAVTNDTKE